MSDAVDSTKAGEADGDAQQRAALHGKICALIDRLADGSRDDGARDALLAELMGYQAQRVAPYGRLCAGTQAGDELPALPTDVFRFARVAAHGAERDVALFQTSGTTSGRRGQHPLRDLSLYDRAAEAAARYALFPDLGDGERMRLLVLSPSPGEAPDSSLAYMLGRFVTWFGDGESRTLWSRGKLHVGRLRDALNGAVHAQEPVAILGTSLALLYADDHFNDDADRKFVLPSGSRIMQTGGFKGRTRSVEAAQMLGMLAARYGVPEAMVIQEYGMTELSSQMYETTLRDAVMHGQGGADGKGAVGPRRLWVPGWVRARAVDPASLRAVDAAGGAAQGVRGLLRIDDAANLDSVCAIQTSDLATVGVVDTAKGGGDAGGLRLHGRAQDAVLRGCSLSVEEALGGAS